MSSSSRSTTATIASSALGWLVATSGRTIAVERAMHEVVWFTIAGERAGRSGTRGPPILNGAHGLPGAQEGDLLLAEASQKDHSAQRSRGIPGNAY